jgi:hypothetical protein
VLPSLCRERRRAGIDKAKAEGKYKGRQVTLDRQKVVQLMGRGMGASEVAKVVGCSRAAIYKILAEYGEGRKPAPGDAAGMIWWNGLTERQRAKALRQAGTAVPVTFRTFANVAWLMFA